ncbi:hypothetical protein KI387_008642, partial [Taxus chinensis]
ASYLYITHIRRRSGLLLTLPGFFLSKMIRYIFGGVFLSKRYVNSCRRIKDSQHQKPKSCLQNEDKGFMRPGTPGMICQTSNLTVLASNAITVAPNAESNTRLLRDKDLTHAIFYEAERGYRDFQGKTMRFSDFLSSRILPLYSPFVDKSAKILSEEVKNYARASIRYRFELLNKIALLMGYESIHAMVAHEIALQESLHGMQCFSKNQEGRGSLPNSFLSCHEHEVRGTVPVLDESDFFQACQRFPCILLGNNPHVNLYGMTEDDSEMGEYHFIENELENSLQQVRNASFDPLTIAQAQNIGDDESGQAAAYFEIDPELEQCTLHLDKEHLHVSNKDLAKTANKVDLEGHIMAHTEVLPEKTTHKRKKRTVHVDSFLDAPIGSIRGITPVQRRKLDENGFHTVRKILHHFPRTYVNFQNAQGQLENGQLLNFTGRVLSSRGKKQGCALGVIEIIVGCPIRGADESCSGCNQYTDEKENKRTVYLHLKKYYHGARFANPWLLDKIRSKYCEGDLVSVSGKVTALTQDDHFEMREYNLDVLEGETDHERLEPCHEEKLYPIYPSKGKLGPKYIGDCIRRLLHFLPVDMDPIPDSFCVKFNVIKLCEAYFGIHCPKDLKEAESARRRFIFDEFFYFQLGLLLQRHEVVKMYIKNDNLAKTSIGLEVGSLGIDKWSQLTSKALRSLPFSLTNAQLRAASEIIWDLRRPVPMNRLLQGDVGCGKTIVALLAALEVISSGYQAAFMVPTELLAVQHHETIVAMMERINEDERPSLALLTGSTSVSEAKSIRKGLETGDIALVVGTHSLISESVNFSALCLAVIDEQHRFGVAQKGKFSSKVFTTMDHLVANDINIGDGKLVAHKAFTSPHVLVMSATPIPRTLALALYGDMSLSQINESLPGRMPVKTFAFCGNNTGFTKAYQMVQKDLDSGGRAFFVYPIIEESKRLPQLLAATAELENISNNFMGYKCDLLHGRMKFSEKEAALQKFKAGETRILLSTQVIEVGIDIPEATMMVVINAERFGVAQLHQLRGRIGRGTIEATCILLASSINALPRLKLLEKSNDGFYLAEADLRFRGPGNLLGREQSGHLPEFSIARLETDGDVLEKAHVAAS